VKAKLREYEREYAKAEKVHASAQRLAKQMREKLNRLAAKSDAVIGTDLQAAFLAHSCFGSDEHFGAGSRLTLEWMLDRYIYLEFDSALERFKDTYEFLVENQHASRNTFEYHNDSEAFYIPTDDERMVLVHGSRYSQDPRYLAVYDPPRYEGSHHGFWVRKVWRRTGGKWKDKRLTLGFYKSINYMKEHYTESNGQRCYRDARDPGHVVTIDRDSKADKVIWDLDTALWYFFYLNSLWCQTPKFFERCGQCNKKYDCVRAVFLRSKTGGYNEHHPSAMCSDCRAQRRGQWKYCKSRSDG